MNIPFRWLMPSVESHIHIQNTAVIIRMFLFLVYLVFIY